MPPNINPIDESEFANVNDIDRTRIDGLEVKIDAISRDVSRLTNAVIGDEQAGNYGIVSRIVKLEARADTIERRYEDMEGKYNKVFAYSAAIAFLVGTVWTGGKMIFDLLVR